MKLRIIFFLQLFFFFFFGVTHSQTDPEFVKVAGFSHPESVVFDDTNNVLFVSNMGGDTKGDGFISKVSMDGKIIDTMWVSGLDDPKGLLVQKGKLFVTDNTRLIEMDLEKEQITKEYSIKDAVMLNDIAVDKNGNLYVSDTRKNSIYKMDTIGEISEWLSTEELESPNGLLFVKGDLWIGAWGPGDKNGNVLKVNPKTKEIQRVSEQEIGNLDGLQQSKEGMVYTSDWASGKIFEIDTLGTFQEEVTSARSVGDILLMDKENLLILPMNLQNGVWWYRLEKE